MRRDPGHVSFEARVALARGPDHARRLVAEGLRDLPVLRLHLVVRHTALGFPGLIRRNLGGFRPAVKTLCDRS